MTQLNPVHIYPNLQAAERAVKHLTQGNFPIDQISIVTQNIETTKHHGFISAGDLAAAKGISSGAWMGGFLGLLVGVTFIWVPGFAPLFVAGPFAVSLLGGLEGMVAGVAAGGLLSALVDLGVSKEHVLNYEAGIKGGEYLVVVNGDETQISQAQTILDDLTDFRGYPADREKILRFLE